MLNASITPFYSGSHRNFVSRFPPILSSLPLIPIVFSIRRSSSPIVSTLSLSNGSVFDSRRLNRQLPCSRVETQWFLRNLTDKPSIGVSTQGCFPQQWTVCRITSIASWICSQLSNEKLISPETGYLDRSRSTDSARDTLFVLRYSRTSRNGIMPLSA